jgi:hypothetical protein
VASLFLCLTGGGGGRCPQFLHQRFFTDTKNMFHLRTAARRTTLRTSSRRRPFTTATPQEKVKTWVQDNQKTLGGGILALVVLKYLTRSVTDAWRRLFLCVFQCRSCLHHGALPSRCSTLSHRTYPVFYCSPEPNHWLSTRNSTP